MFQNLTYLHHKSFGQKRTLVAELLSANPPSPDATALARDFDRLAGARRRLNGRYRHAREDRIAIVSTTERTT